MAICFVSFSFASCKGSNDDVTLVSDDKWRDAVNASADTGTTYGRLTDDEIKTVVEGIVREETGDDSYTWDGSYSSLTDEQKDKIEDKIAQDNKIRVEINDSGISYDKIVPTYEEIVKYINDTVGDELKEQHGDDYVWNGDYTDLTDEQQDEVEQVIDDDGYDVIVDDDGVISTPSDPVSETVLSSVSRQNLQTFGGTTHDRFMAVTATSDGGYAALINTNSRNGDCSDANINWARTVSGVVKYNANGEVQWKKFIGGNNTVELSAIAQLKDGSIVTVGYTSSTDISGISKTGRDLDGLIVKYSAEGEQTAIKAVVGKGSEYFSSVAATPDGGFVVGGKVTSSDGDFDGLTAKCIHAVLFKYDKDCNIYWKRALNGGTMHSNFQSIAVNKDGEIFALCLTMASTNDFKGITGFGMGDSVIFKFNQNGERLWYKTIVSTGYDDAKCVACSPDGGCVIVGHYNATVNADGTFASYHNYGDFDGFFAKYNKDGTLDWINTLNGFYAEDITGIAAIDGGYVLCGTSKSSNIDFAASGNKGETDAFVLLISETGEKLDLQTIGGKQPDTFLGVCAIDASTFAVVGGTQSSDGGYAGLTPSGKTDDYICTSAVFKTVKS